MAKYQAPKRQLHRDFVYLDHETVINSLSAFEAGRIDEIIEKTSESADRGFDGAVNIRALKAGASKKKEAELHEELVRKRTRFSAFEGWYQQLKGEEAIGTFEEWDQEVRDSLGVGDTIEFRASVRLSPLYLLFRTFGSYANEAGPTSTIFKTTQAAAAEAKANARIMESWTRGPDGSQASSVYFHPIESAPDSPRLVGRVAQDNLLRGLGELDGQFNVIAQVESVLSESDEVSAIRVIRDTPATPLEMGVIATAMGKFSGDVADSMGVEVKDDDIMYRHPAVVVRPIAIFR
jgi:hypothetical protein